MLSHKLMNPSLSYIHTKKQYTSKTVRKKGLLVLGFLKRTSLTLNSQTHSLISHIATSRLASLSVSLESRLIHTRRRLLAGVETPAFQRLVVFHGLLVAGDRSNSSGLRRSSSSGFGSSSSLSRRGPWTVGIIGQAPNLSDEDIVADFEITPWNSQDALKKGSGGWKKVVAAFGEEIFLENGEVNRPMLGQIVFSNPDKCQFLNRLWAPHISSGIFWEVVKLGLKGYKVIVFDVPLLFEAKMDKFTKPIIVVWIDLETQRKRLMGRDK